MLNGRNHSAARKGLTVNGRGNSAVAEADASALYGEYEQKLASDLAELLKSGGGAPRVASDGAAAVPHRPMGQSTPPPLSAARTGRQALLHSETLVHPETLRQRSFVPASAPHNDFVDAGDREPMPFSWRHEPRPPQPSWIARQMRSGLLGLGAGLIVVLPAVAVMSGRLDTVLPSWKSTAAERAPRLYEVPMTPPKVASVQPARVQAATIEPPRAPAASAVRVESVATVRHTFASEVPPKSETTETPAVAARSVGTVEAFPPSSGVSSSAPAPSRIVAAVPPPAPVADEAMDLLALGQRLLEVGDIAGARTPLARAANLGNSAAMLALGETFDPNMLAAWGALDVKSDPSTARLFYGRAAGAGQARAKMRLEALN